VQAPLRRLKRNDDTPVTRAALERAMLLVGDMPGAAMPELTISPGEAPGTSDFDVELKAGKRVQGYVLADNQGSEYTGKYRLNAGVDINSPFGIGDRLSFNGMSSKDKGLLNGRLAYGFPLNGDGLRMEIAAYRTTYELGDVYKDLDATGQSNVLEAGLSYPLIRGNSRNLYLTANVASKQLRDEIGIADYVERKKAYVGSLGLRHENWGTLFGRSLFTEASAGISYGRLSILDAQQEAANRNSIDSVGHYARLNLSLQAQHALTDTLSAHVSASAQKALMGKNLDSSEQMSISGASGVRAYREVVSGDNAYFLNAELRYQLPALGGLSHSLGVFSGTGRSHYENADHVTSNGIRLSDVGLSYYASYRSLILKVQLAHAVGAIPDEVADKGRTNVYAQVGVLF
jgi:hemolysin activation/secretion protein